MPTDPKEVRAIEKIKEYDRLSNVRSSLDSEWQNIAELIYPSKATITSKTTRPSDMYSNIFDTTGQDSLTICASGLLQWTTPKNTPWFSYTPISSLKKSTAVQKWLAECTVLAREYLANSNFYSERHESLIDKILIGTSALFSSVDSNNNTYFESLGIGTYVFKENYRGIIDCVYRKIELTARQAAQQFGEEALPKMVKDDINSSNDRKHEFLHVCEARTPKEISADTLKSADKKAYASLYIHIASKTIVLESGFDTFPFHVGRWNRFLGSDNNNSWGVGPGNSALPDARQANYLSKMLDIAAGKAVFPPLLVPDSYEGALDTTPKAINYYSAALGPDSIQALNVVGDLNIGLQRLSERQQAIKTKFHADLWSLLKDRTTQKTAYEVSQLMAEKLDAIAPAFDRDISEVIDPMMVRLFNLWASRGMLPPPPPEAILSTEDGFANVPNPEIQMSGKLAMALRAMQNNSADQQLQRLMSVAQANPEVLDIWNFDAYAKQTAFNVGVPSDFLRNDDEVQAMRQQRAQAAQLQQQAALLAQGAQAIGPENTGKLLRQQGLLE